jgi:hypothetical protein
VVFTEPGQILACLEAIAADKEVEVVRINNKLARDYDANITAGYRCAARADFHSRKMFRFIVEASSLPIAHRGLDSFSGRVSSSQALHEASESLSTPRPSCALLQHSD